MNFQKRKHEVFFFNYIRQSNSLGEISGGMFDMEDGYALEIFWGRGSWDCRTYKLLKASKIEFKEEVSPEKIPEGIFE